MSELALTYTPVEIKELNGGHQVIFHFPNGYGASVVRSSNIGIWGRTYGADQGLWELAVLKFEGFEWYLTYDTEITDDVIGYLEPEDVDALLERIKALPA